MTYFTPTPAQATVFTALGSFLTAILPAGVYIVQGQANRVPQPSGPDYVVMTPVTVTRISTNVDTWADAVTGGTSSGGIVETQSFRVVIQCDVFGPNATDNALMASTLFRGLYAADWFADRGFAAQGISPLHADDPRQMAFVNGEAQYEDRWSLDVTLQVDQGTLVPQDFADAATVKINAPADAA